MALALRSRLRYRDAAAPRLQAIVPVLLFGFALWLYHPAAEYIIGGKDPGVYVNEGVQIAQRGDVITRDDARQSLPPDLRGLFIPAALSPERTTASGSWASSSPIPRAARSSASSRTCIPAAIAIGYGLDGLTGARHVSSLCAALGVVACSFSRRGSSAVRRPRSPPRCSPSTSSRSGSRAIPNSEIVAQVLILAGMLAFARAYIDGDRFFGAGRGAAARPVAVCAIDGVFAIAAACAAAILLRRGQARPAGSRFSVR